MACAYPPMPYSMVFCIVLGLALLLYSIESIENIWQYFFRVFLAVLIWNILTIYWIVNSTLAGEFSPLLPIVYFILSLFCVYILLNIRQFCVNMLD